VETPAAAWQAAINKEVTRDSVVEILREAKKRGWRGAKFYFMIGLPSAMPAAEAGMTPNNEEAEIAGFIADVGRRSGMRFNINVGIFVPKPHTPYQWAAQIKGEKAAAKLDFIRSRLRPLGHKVSVSDPLISLIEGLLSRGDERAGLLAEEAYYGGSRLDAWSEYINKEKWLEILEKNQKLVDEFCGEKAPELPLPWQGISSGVSAGYLRKELDRSNTPEFTLPCIENCANPCGICGANAAIVQNNIQGKAVSSSGESGGPSGTEFTSLCTENHTNSDGDNADANIVQKSIRDKAIFASVHKSDPGIQRVLFSFSKKGGAVFHGHLSLIEIFSMAFNRAGLPVMYTQGFNPLVKIEIVAPLSTGVSADAEMAAVDFAEDTAVDAAEFAAKLNQSLPEGLRVEQAKTFRIPRGEKKHSLSSLLWGFAYANEKNETEYVRAAEEKKYRQRLLDAGIPLFEFRRISVLAKNPADTGVSYFEAFGLLYADT
jgi:hypothetical protein